MTSSKPIGWALLKESWPSMIGYVLFIAFIVLVRPPIYITAIIIMIYALIKMAWGGNFTVWKYFKTCIFICIFLAIIYAVYYFIGGWVAMILAHIIGVTMIVISRWQFIKKCDAQIKQQMDVIHNKVKNGKKN